MTMTAARAQHPVDAPTDLTGEDYKEAVKSALKDTKDDDVPTLASAAAFRLFLSLFPTLVAVVGVWSLLTDPAELSAAVGRLRGILPGDAANFVEVQLEDLAAKDSGGVMALLAGIAGALWAATGAASGLMKALSRAYDVEETRKFPKLRVQSLFLCLALLAALGAIFVLLIVGPQVEDALLGGAPGFVDALATVARYGLAIAVLVALFAFVYWMGPDREQPSWEWISPGAVVGTVGWLLASFGFAIYAQRFGNYETYGALAGPIVLMLWLQLTMLIVLVGAEINAEVLRRRNLHKEMEAGIGFAVPAVAGALPTPDQESGGTGIAEGHSEMAGPGEHADGSDRAPDVPSSRPREIRLPDSGDDSSERPRRMAGIATAVIGGGLALIFARSRRR